MERKIDRARSGLLRAKAAEMMEEQSVVVRLPGLQSKSDMMSCKASSASPAEATRERVSGERSRSDSVEEEEEEEEEDAAFVLLLTMKELE